MFKISIWFLSLLICRVPDATLTPRYLQISRVLVKGNHDWVFSCQHRCIPSYQFLHQGVNAESFLGSGG
jgi:hypothetical protein